MRKNLNLIGVVAGAMSLFTGNAFSQNNLYISTTGTDAGTCPTASPCLSLDYALNQASNGDTIHIAGGNYGITDPIFINKEVAIIGSATDKPVFSYSDNDNSNEFIFGVDTNNVTISNIRIELGLDNTSGYAGIVTTNDVDSLTIKNNEIVSTATLNPSMPMTFKSFGMVLVTSATGYADIEENYIGSSDVNNPALNQGFGRGIVLGKSGNELPISGNGFGGIVKNNVVTAFYPVQSVKMASDVAITDNTFTGTTFIGYVNSGVNVDFSNNDLFAIPVGLGAPFTQAQIDQLGKSVLDVVEIVGNNNGNISVENNTISNYYRIGLFSQASKNLTIKGNTFTPSATADSALAIMVNTKLATTATQSTSYKVEASILGNTFNSSTVPAATNKCTAIIFADDYGVNADPFGNVVIGGTNTADKNTFDANLGYYIALSNASGSTAGMPQWTGSSVTTAKPVSQSFEALINSNNYNLDSTAIELKNIDNQDSTGVGRIIIWKYEAGLNNLNIANLQVYPNPSNGILNVTSDSNDKLHMTIVDVTGRTLYTSDFTKFATVNVNAFKAGAYFIQFSNGEKSQTVNFIKE